MEGKSSGGAGEGPAIEYRLFRGRSDTSFLRWIEKRRNHPTKKLLLDWLAAEPLLPQTFSLLDVGCGPGNLAQMLLDHKALRDRVDYTGVDQSEDACAFASRTFKQFKFVTKDVVKDGLPEGPWDVISINEVVEHIPAAEPLLDAAAALKPKILTLTGFAIVPGIAGHVTKWDPEEACFKNSYSFHLIHEHLCKLAERRPFLTAQLAYKAKEGERWFPVKCLTLFYVRLAAEPLPVSAKSKIDIKAGVKKSERPRNKGLLTGIWRG